jgi:glucosamine--fructose-6-phosphate aminotransferase (isomerizing)
MCGIVAYIGDRDATSIIVNGLKKLEYRGYDSAGIALIENGKIEVRREAGKLARLEALINEQPVHGNIGIGHTRWATHGEPNQVNAHPHLGPSGKVVVVHNGIVENYLTLREELIAEGATFKSETDTEVIAHLIEFEYEQTKDLFTAVQNTLKRISGAHGIVVMSV